MSGKRRHDALPLEEERPREAHAVRALLNTLAPKSLRIAFSVILMAIAMSLCYGFQYRINAGQAFSYYFSFSAIFIIILTFLTYNLFGSNETANRFGVFHGWCGLALMIASFTLTLFFNSKLLAPMPWYVLSAATALLALYVHSKWTARASTWFFGFVGLAFVALVIAKTDLWQRGDMLSVVEAAGKEFLAGKQPYRPYPEVYMFLGSMRRVEIQDLQAFASNYQLAHTAFYYLPGIWLAYLPAVSIGIDPRVLNLVFLACLVLFFERLLPIHQDRPIVLSLTLYPVLLSPSVIGIVSAVHELHYWLLLLLTMLFIEKKRYWPASIFFGLSLATRQGTLFLVAPLFAYLSLQLRWKELLRYALAALAVYLLVTVPFAVWWGDNGMFWKHLYFDLALLPGATGLRRDIGMTNLLEWAGVASSGSVIQLGIVLFATAYLFIRREHDLGWPLQFLGATYIWLVVFNSYSVRYVYYAGFFLVLAGAAMALGGFRNTGQSSLTPVHRVVKIARKG
jgi:hypothetical protein